MSPAPSVYLSTGANSAFLESRMLHRTESLAHSRGCGWQPAAPFTVFSGFSAYTEVFDPEKEREASISKSNKRSLRSRQH